MKIRHTASIMMIQNKMPKIEQDNSMPISLHYALTDSQCNICGGQLEWQADFDNINQPKYVSQHCNQDYAIHIETVKVVMLGKASKDRQKQEQEQGGVSMKQDEPKALKMAEAMKRQQQQQEQEQHEER
jgi:hypothetical protein